MPLAHTFYVGKARIRLEVEGCLSCGTRWSSGWEKAREVSIRVGTKERSISIYKCADCISREGLQGDLKLESD